MLLHCLPTFFRPLSAYKRLLPYQAVNKLSYANGLQVSVVALEAHEQTAVRDKYGSRIENDVFPQ